MVNPLKTYYKIKKYFRPLGFCFQFKIKKKFDKWFEYDAQDVKWKQTEHTPLFISTPYLKLTLFKYFEISINWFSQQCPDKVYWTAALYWLYYNKTLSKAIKLSTERNFKILHKKYQDLFQKKQLRKIYAK